MSLSKGGQMIHCDGKNCDAVTAAPVALRPRLVAGQYASQAAAGWLFLVRQNGCLHFCPACARQHLEQALEIR